MKDLKKQNIDLTDKILEFCQIACGCKLRKYQEPLAKGIIMMLLQDEGDELTALCSRQSGKTQVIAMICAGCMIILPKLAEMFPNHLGLQKYKDGLWIGIFAPSNEQSDTTYSRMKQMIMSQHAKMILDDEDLDIGLATKGRVIALTNGSFCKPTSAAKTANIESKTYQLVILEEAQDLDLRVVRKSIGPMLADKDGCFIKVGTANDKKSDFSESIRRNRRRDFNHFGWTWRTVAKENRNYGNFIKKEMERIGADSDEFKMSYECIFILERGMFITEEQFEALIESSPKGMDFMEGCRHICVAGIDFAKKGDSTVITIGLPDYDKPWTDDDGEERYNVRILDWLELEGDYEVQFWKMIEFLDKYNIGCIVGDSTGNGDAIVDRLKNHYLDRCDVMGVVFTNANKDMIYKNLQKEILHNRIWIPNSSGAVRSTRFKKFRVQMCDLEKEWKGRFMVCHHPDAKDAKDDYCDSLALMEWAVYQGMMAEMEEYENPLFNRRRSA